MELHISFFIDGNLLAADIYEGIEIPVHLPMLGDVWTYESIQYKVVNRVWRTSGALDIHLIATPEVGRV